MLHKFPKKNLDLCFKCKGSGLTNSENPTPIDSNYPHLAIIGGGIGGSALAVACLHRGIPFTLYERDTSFDVRSQGYGLTLQQASKSIEALGIFSLEGGIISTRHLVHKPNGKIIGEWGLRKWKKSIPQKNTKRKNIHIARQSLRSALLQNLLKHESLKWGHSFVSYSKNDNRGINIIFKKDGKIQRAQADLLVGADGIRSSVRRSLINEDQTPLQYLGCMVILGICPLKSLSDIENPLLDSATVFQTVNGTERIYVMPYDEDNIMWQLSFPLPEAQAKKLHSKGSQAMKNEALRRLKNWHNPIPQILKTSLVSQITGYPVYDRELLDPQYLKKYRNATLIGDAAHPMSPFKGQGANQAILDALNLARSISKNCGMGSNWKEKGIRETVLNNFEKDMLTRTSSKVQDSRKAVKLLHSKAVLHEGDEPRGRGFGVSENI